MFKVTFTLGERIKELRAITNMSQEELGRRVGVQRAAINKYEKGTVTNVPIATIENIAKVFDVSPTYLVGWEEKPTNPLAIEVKVIESIKNIFGDDYVELMETYSELNKTGKKRVQTYTNEMWHLYRDQTAN